MLPLNKTSPTPCWLAIRLPHLSLDLLTRGQRCSQMPLAITGTLDRRDRIIDCNPAALSGGVKPGMPLAAALGILDTLQATERDRQAEQQALQRLAAWKQAPANACSDRRKPCPAAWRRSSCNWATMQ